MLQRQLQEEAGLIHLQAKSFCSGIHPPPFPVAFDFLSIASETDIRVRACHLGKINSHQALQTLLFILCLCFSCHSIVVTISYKHIYNLEGRCTLVQHHTHDSYQYSFIFQIVLQSTLLYVKHTTNMHSFTSLEYSPRPYFLFC